jgi:MoxR-like ATPase
VLPFVGRERELDLLQAALGGDGHAILEGRYGMGRSALLHEAAARAGAAWRFAVADFALPPAAIGAQLWEQLLGAGRGRPRPGNHLAMRAAVLRAPLADSRPPQSQRWVLALDNIASLSPRKLDLVRRLADGGHFRLAAVVERFLPAADRRRLDACLAPACRIVLGPLAPAATRRFFSLLAAAHDLPWNAEVIAGLARASRGYPLRMQEQACRELAGRAGSAPGGGQVAAQDGDGTAVRSGAAP